MNIGICSRFESSTTWCVTRNQSVNKPIVYMKSQYVWVNQIAPVSVYEVTVSQSNTPALSSEARFSSAEDIIENMAAGLLYIGENNSKR